MAIRYCIKSIFDLVPPAPPALKDGWGADIGSSFGPFKEGDMAALSCEVKGGKLCSYIIV